MNIFSNTSYLQIFSIKIKDLCKGIEDIFKQIKDIFKRIFLYL